MSRKIFKTVTKLAGGVVGGILGKALFGGGKKSATAPETPNFMPTPDVKALKRARLRWIIG